MLLTKRVSFISILLLITFHTPALFGQNVAVVYQTEQGHTKAMAEAVAKGARASTNGHRGATPRGRQGHR